MAERLDVSKRTIYRDIQDLTLSGVPVIAEAGLGYRLVEGFRLPPLMFDEEELGAGGRLLWASEGVYRRSFRQWAGLALP
ncbi:helix-turn-helix transcriptional regulator, partial [Endothiovibrio diazotrophicus]